MATTIKMKNIFHLLFIIYSLNKSYASSFGFGSYPSRSVLHSGDLPLLVEVEDETPRQWIVSCNGNYSAYVILHTRQLGFGSESFKLLPPSSLIIYTTSNHINKLITLSNDDDQIASISLFENKFKYRNQDFQFSIQNNNKKYMINSLNIHLFGSVEGGGQVDKVAYAQLIAEKWKLILSKHEQLIGSEWKLRAVSSTKLLFTVMKQPPPQQQNTVNQYDVNNIQWMIDWFSHQDIVHWISPSSQPGSIRPRNAAAKVITQTEGVLFYFKDSEGTASDWRRYPISTSSSFDEPDITTSLSSPSFQFRNTLTSDEGKRSLHSDMKTARRSKENTAAVASHEEPNLSAGYSIIGGCISTVFGCCASDGMTSRQKLNSEYGCPSFVIRTGKPGLSQFGLDGSGELISIGDTGLDYTGCFFHDKKNTVPIFDNLFKVHVSTPQGDDDDEEGKLKLSRKHRKVAGYWSLMDDSDKVGGHGTHVSGSTAGSFLPLTNEDDGDDGLTSVTTTRACSQAGLDRYDGMANGAKILFTDLQCNTPGGCTCGNETWCPCLEFKDSKCPSNGYLYPPPHLGEGYLSPLYKQGARINTNSWGSSCSSGGLCSFTDDSRAREVDEFVYNHDDMLVLFAAGNDGDDNGFSSLDAQSYLKNGLSIGASTTRSDSLSSLVNGRDRLKPSSQNAVKCKAFHQEEELDVCFSSSCACHEITRQNCSSSCRSQCSETCWGEQFIKREEVDEGREGRGSLYVEVDNDLAYFSSIGPTSDGRWKPDLVAPGFYIASAHSTGGKYTCGAELTCGSEPRIVLPSLSRESFHQGVQQDDLLISINVSPPPTSGIHTPATIMLNEMSLESTHTLSKLSFQFYIESSSTNNVSSSFAVDDLASKLSLNMEGLLLESASEYDYTWAEAERVILNQSSLQCSIIKQSDDDDDSTVMQECQMSILFDNVTLWASKKYLIGVTCSVFMRNNNTTTTMNDDIVMNHTSLNNSHSNSVKVHFMNRKKISEETNKNIKNTSLLFNNQTSSISSCFGTWDSSYLLNGSLENSGILCQSSDSEEAADATNSLGKVPGSFFPFNLTLHASPIDTLRDHLTIMAGTSMATPIIAGSAALVRQYFREGYFENSSNVLDELLGQLYDNAVLMQITSPSTFQAHINHHEFSGFYNFPFITIEDGGGGGGDDGEEGGMINQFQGRRGGFSPSAALVKAVLINGAVPLSGLLCSGEEEIDMELSMRSHVYEGYGKVSLSDSLSIFKANPDFKLEVLGMMIPDSKIMTNNNNDDGSSDDSNDDTSTSTPLKLIEPIISHQQVHEYCFESLYHKDNADDDVFDDVLYINNVQSIPLSATLVWTDPPVSPSSSHYLAHDLDLMISFHNKQTTSRDDDDGEEDDVKLYRGNNNPIEDNHIPDSINNVEKIRLLNITNEFRKSHLFMKVSVEGSHVAYGEQSYSLVVSGVYLKVTNCRDYEPKKTSWGEIDYILFMVFILVVLLTLGVWFAFIECKKSYKQSSNVTAAATTTTTTSSSSSISSVAPGTSSSSSSATNVGKNTSSIEMKTRRPTKKERSTNKYGEVTSTYGENGQDNSDDDISDDDNSDDGGGGDSQSHTASSTSYSGERGGGGGNASLSPMIALRLKAATKETTTKKKTRRFGRRRYPKHGAEQEEEGTFLTNAADSNTVDFV